MRSQPMMQLCRTFRLPRLSRRCGAVCLRPSYPRSLLDRAERLGALNAFITLDPDQVLAAARECDRVRRIARTAYPGKGQLGHHNAAHVQRHARAQRLSPRRGCRILTPLLAQGAIVMGKTNLEELSAVWSSNNGESGAVRTLCAAAQSGRKQRRLGRGGGRAHRAPGGRRRHIGIDPRAGEHVRGRRFSPDLLPLSCGRMMALTLDKL